MIFCLGISSGVIVQTRFDVIFFGVEAPPFGDIIIAAEDDEDDAESIGRWPAKGDIAPRSSLDPSFPSPGGGSHVAVTLSALSPSIPTLHL